jgi:hypothetical protein
MKTLLVTLAITTVTILLSIGIAKGEVSGSRDSTKMKGLSDARASLMRLDIINATDKTHLSTMEKKKLRKELRVIKNRLYDLNGSRYIPIGAIVVLLLLPFAVYQTIKIDD